MKPLLLSTLLLLPLSACGTGLLPGVEALIDDMPYEPGDHAVAELDTGQRALVLFDRSDRVTATCREVRRIAAGVPSEPQGCTLRRTAEHPNLAISRYISDPEAPCVGEACLVYIPAGYHCVVHAPPSSYVLEAEFGVCAGGPHVLGMTIFGSGRLGLDHVRWEEES